MVVLKDEGEERGRPGRILGRRQAEDVNVNWAGEAVVMEPDWRPIEKSKDTEEDATGQRRILWRKQAEDADVDSAGEVVGVEPDPRPREKDAEDGGFGDEVHQIEICWMRCNGDEILAEPQRQSLTTAGKPSVAE